MVYVWVGMAGSAVYCLLFTRHNMSGVCLSVMGCVGGACLVLSCRIVLWVVEWRWCDGCVVFVACLSCSLSSLLLLLLLLVVFGVVRAQPCEHARYPRTPLCLSCCLSSLLFSLCSTFLYRPLFCVWNGGGGVSPCVGMFGGHDGNRESVSFSFVFLIVACPAFAVSSVASSAVAFGAEDSAVVRVIGSA